MSKDFHIGKTTGYQKALFALLVVCCSSLILIQDGGIPIKITGLLSLTALFANEDTRWQGALLVSLAGVIVFVLGVMHRIYSL